jgi:hypothetical protein
MFEILIIGLSRLLLVFIGFKLYRMFVGRDVFKQHVIGRSGMTISGAPRTQRGYISLKRSRYKQAGVAKFRKLDGDTKAPWGW